MNFRLRRPSKSSVFALLMSGAALAALLPARGIGCADGATQPLSPLAWVLHTVTRRVLVAAKRSKDPVPTREALETLRRENEQLRRQVGHQQLMIKDMERLMADVTGLRDQLNDNRARIIVASVIRGDTSPQRETLTISKGRRHGVRVGDWVAAGVRWDERDPAATGRDLLLQQWLIGRVSQVHPYVSEVQLATDPQFGPEAVWAARALPGGGWQSADRQCGLVGTGGGRMRIDRASENYLASGYTTVVLPLAHPRPMGLALGRIIAARTLETGLHYDLTVEPWSQARLLSNVYVISFAP